VGVYIIVSVVDLVMKDFPCFIGWRGEMRRFKFLTKKCILLVSVSALLLTGLLQCTCAEAKETDKQKVVRQVAEKWIQVAAGQYQRGFYAASEQSLLRARDYQQYLTEANRKELDKLIEKVHATVLERKRVLERVQTADELVEQGKLSEARSCFEEVKDSQFLTEEKRKQIAGAIKRIENQLSRQKKEIVDL